MTDTEYKIGDTVYMKEEFRGAFEKQFHGPVTVTDVSDSWVTITGDSFEGRKNFLAYRFEKREERVEGAEIKHEDIRIGDTIRNTYVSDDLKISREGTVDAIGSGYAGSTALWTADNKRIDVDPRTDTFTLIKATKVDEVLERVQTAAREKVVEIEREDGYRLARKNTSLWTVYAPDGWEYKTDEEFADYIREASVVWHA